MNADFKKTVLRMIPYGIYILTTVKATSRRRRSTGLRRRLLRRHSWLSALKPIQAAIRP